MFDLVLTCRELEYEDIHIVVFGDMFCHVVVTQRRSDNSDHRLITELLAV